MSFFAAKYGRQHMLHRLFLPAVQEENRLSRRYFLRHEAEKICLARSGLGNEECRNGSLGLM